MSAANSTGAFLERDDLVARLAQQVDAVEGNGPRFVAITGEAGVGKTRLVEELRRRDSGEATYLYGRAFQATATTPYAVWVDALEQHLRLLPRRELLHVLPGGSDLPRLFPACQHLSLEPLPAPNGDIGSEQVRLFGQMGTMLSRMARDRRLVVVLDNLQWADASSVELLHAVVRALDGCKVLIFGIYRGDDLRSDSSLNVCVESLVRLGLAESLAVPPLTVDATGAILIEETGRNWPTGAVHQLHHLTQGNAFFVREFGKHAAARGRDVPPTWNSIDEMPGTVQALLNERLRELDEACRRVLAFAAAFEAPIGYRLLLVLTGFDEERLLDATDRLCALRFLAEIVDGHDVAYAFHKPLVQAIVYRGMGAARRQFLHRTIAAEVMRTDDHDAATIARHLLAGAAADRQHDALPYLLRAAHDAVSVFGNHEAIALLDSALQLARTHVDSRALLPRIHLDHGESFKRLGRFTEAIDSWTQALPLADARVAATLRRCIARTHWQAGHEKEAMRVLQDGIARLAEAEATEEAAFLRQEYALSLARQGRLQEALDEAARALALTDEERHPEAVARIHIVICLAHGYRGDLRSAVQAIKKSLALCEDLPYPGAAFLAHYTMAGLLRYEGDFAVFEQHCDACMRIAERMHSVALVSWAQSIRIERYTFEGRVDEAIELGKSALALDQTTGQGAVLPRTHAFLAVAYWVAGDLAKARHHLDESKRLVSELEKNELRVVVVQACCEAFVAFHEGRFEAVLTLLSALRDTITKPVPITFYALHPHALSLAAEAAARLGRAEEAKKFLHELQLLRKPSASGCDGTTLHVQGLLRQMQRDFQGACHDLGRAAEHWEATQRPWNAARARVDLAEALAASGADDLSVAALNAAGAIYTSIRATREAAAVGQRLRQAGRRPLFGQPRKTLGQPVSNRETEVIALVAQGKSNKEIASLLFLSELTIETHVKNILRKLGLKSRTQVAAYAVQRARSNSVMPLAIFEAQIAR
ncbi:helix-turn-helix transcriptional regulator [Variovorax sp. Sphag1AA]|uniref:helix-turn-helix transcriptional regulator n=1 Tax=Variovorax sp. Sphag1AA TaxID=2587027 RepID=UPI001609052E|nr:helix-turn-helix transcriptional regulator [Variovorax sp. Sphag1AA]MBB3182008.1 DNA-binding CsgD family transcriptional regulator/tetratricopeptide (TPR) repeat protein [Variovorax sp. Sphag1AA]